VIAAKAACSTRPAVAIAQKGVTVLSRKGAVIGKRECRCVACSKSASHDRAERPGSATFGDALPKRRHGRKKKALVTVGLLLAKRFHRLQKKKKKKQKEKKKTKKKKMKEPRCSPYSARRDCFRKSNRKKYEALVPLLSVGATGERQVLESTPWLSLSWRGVAASARPLGGGGGVFPKRRGV